MFVKDRNRYINTEHAVTGDIAESRGNRAVVLKDRDGRELAIVSEDALIPPDITIAGPLAACFIDRDGDIQWRAIVAWRIGRNGDTEPVIGGGTRPAGEMFVEFADGSLLGMSRRFAGVKEATKAVRDAAAEREPVQ